MRTRPASSSTVARKRSRLVKRSTSLPARTVFTTTSLVVWLHASQVEPREGPHAQAGQVAGQRRRLALEGDGDGPRGLRDRRARLQRGPVLGVLPLQDEELMALLAAELLQQKNAPAPRQLPLQLGE